MWYHGLPLHCNICSLVYSDIAIQTSKHLNKIKKVCRYVLTHEIFPTLTEWVVHWNRFLNDVVLKKRLYLTFTRKNSVIIWCQKSCDTRCIRYASILRYLLCGFNYIYAWNFLDKFGPDSWEKIFLFFVIVEYFCKNLTFILMMLLANIRRNCNNFCYIIWY